jgi:rhamnulokinase
MQHYLAIDLGAGSGRAIIGILDKEIIKLKEIYRFENEMLPVQGHFHWDVYAIYKEILSALKICANKEKIQPQSMAVDTWGVDYGLFDSYGQLINIPYAYRDARTDSAIGEFTKIMPKKQIYDKTGNMFMQLNTLFQLYAEKKNRPEVFDFAKDLLFMPDIINYMLTGIRKTEFTFATTSQLYNPINQNWDEDIFKNLGISVDIMQDIIEAGTKIGLLTDEIANTTGVDKIPVIAVASHDTGSAVTAIPALDDDWAFISSGTWSVMGFESPYPVINDKSYQFNFTNEGLPEHKTRLLKNIVGLWLLNESKKIWDQEIEYSFPQLIEMASKVKSFRSLIDPDHPAFANPANMVQAIADFCRETSQPVPDSPGEFAQCIFQSLALKNRFVFDQINELAGKPKNKIYITGGGSKNELLNQYIANACGVPAITALPEGTATGNVMVQAMAGGQVSSVHQIRKIIGNSYTPKTYQPKDHDEWEKGYDKFKSIVND